MAPAVGKALRQFPIVSITGPRQSGKTTLAHLAASGYTYLNMELEEHSYFARKDPVSFLQQYAYKVILDEVQAVPSLFPYLQQHTDKLGKNGAYLLSGSQNFQLLESISQTLAGRVAVFSLLPLSMAEIFPYLRSSQKNWKQLCLKGFYPRLFREKINPGIFFNSYLKTYVEKDVRQVLNIHNARAFTQFIKLCAIRTGTVLNTQDIATATGVDNKTINRWVAVLEASYILHLLPPYYNNFDKRIVKKPKIYFYDTGLLCSLLGISTETGLQNHKMLGSIFENFIINEKLKQYYNKGLSPAFYFWQDTNGREVDLLIEEDKLLVHEIKSSTVVKPEFFKNINLFSSIAKDAGIKTKKYLINTGDKSYQIKNTGVQSWLGLSE